MFHEFNVQPFFPIIKKITFQNCIGWVKKKKTTIIYNEKKRHQHLNLD